VLTRLVLAVVAGLAPACMPVDFPVPFFGQHRLYEPPRPPPAPPEPPSEATVVVVADVGGGIATDLGAPAMVELSPHSSLDASAGIGRRRGTHAYLAQARIEYGAQGAPIRLGAIDGMVLDWATLPLVHIPIECEAGVGLGIFDRGGEHVSYWGLDLIGSFGVPLRAERDLLLALRITNLHSASNALSVLGPPFGDQQVLAFSLGLSWRH
jgi:hypothetical protein